MQRSWFSTLKQWATFQIYCVQFGPESPILQAIWKLTMPYLHIGDHVADFGRISTKSAFVMATSQYNCAMVNQNCVGIGPNSGILLSCLLCHEGSSGRLLKWAFGAELEAAKVKRCPMFIITRSWPLHERVWYFISLQTNILAIKPILKNYLNFTFPQSSI